MKKPKIKRGRDGRSRCHDCGMDATYHKVWYSIEVPRGGGIESYNICANHLSRRLSAHV